MSNLGNKEVFAKNLAFYVARSGRDQREIAETVGVAASTFNEWVKGKKYPRIDKIEMLANYFGVLKSDLIEDSDAKVTTPDAMPKRFASSQAARMSSLCARCTPSKKPMATALSPIGRRSPSL